MLGLKNSFEISDFLDICKCIKLRFHYFVFFDNTAQQTRDLLKTTSKGKYTIFNVFFTPNSNIMY